MDFENFKEQFTEDVGKALSERGIDATVTTNTVEKMNESYEALTITPEGSHVGVNLNMDRFFEAYENGVSYDEVVNKATDVAEQGIKESPAVIKGMTEVMQEMMGEDFASIGFDINPADEMMYVASVPDKIHGAGVIAYQDFMDQAAEKLGGDFFVLPSSIHEVLLSRFISCIIRKY